MSSKHGYPEGTVCITYIRKNEDDQNRRQTYCKYYRYDKICQKSGIACMSSSHCEFYEERPDRERKNKKTLEPKWRDFSGNGNIDVNAKRTIPPEKGTKVIHTQHGFGTVYSNKISPVIVIYENGKKETYDYPEPYKSSVQEIKR